MASWIPARVLLAALAWEAKPSSACTLIAIGKDATATGHPMVAHTDDSGLDTTDVRFTRVPHQKWPAGSVRHLYDWADGYPRVVSSSLGPEYAPVGQQKEFVPLAHIPQVEETYAYWDMDYGVQNEMGLSIGESTCTAKTVGWPASPDKPYGYCHVGIEDLSKIALERCATARCAVQTMGDIAVEQGFYSADSGEPTAPDYQDSAEGLAVADTKEVWVFNVMTGKNNASAIWAAQRIPDNHVAAVGNTFTIRKMNLSDSANFLYSPGVTQLAEEMGWWSQKDDEPGVFDFFQSYGFTPPEEMKRNILSFYSGRRMWRIFSMLSPAEGAKLDPNKGNLPYTEMPYPGSVPVPKEGLVTPSMVMNVLRDHYEGTPYDLTAGMAAGPFGTPNRGPSPPKGTQGAWERAISMHRTSWSYVLEALPSGRSVSWLGYDSPHGTAYLPFFGSSSGSAPESFRSHDVLMSKFSTKAAWWAFNMVNQYSDLNFRLINADVRSHAQKIEEEGRQEVEKCVGKANAIASRQGETMARAYLTDCSNKFAEEKVAEWWELGWSLFAKYGRYAVTSNETGTGEIPQQYPDWWINNVEVGFTLWSPAGPFQGSPINAVASTFRSSRVLQTSVLALLALTSFVGVASYRVGKWRGQQAAMDKGDFYVVAP